MEQPEKLVTAAVIADLVGVGEATIRRWARQGIIPSVRVKHKIVRFDKGKVMAMLEEGQK